MTRWLDDPTYFASPKMAAQPTPEQFGYVAATNYGCSDQPDQICVIDLDPASPTYSQITGHMELPYVGDEVHHFGWNACGPAHNPTAPQPHPDRRYLIVPGLRSSRIYIVDTQPNPRQPHIAKILEPAEVMARSGYSRLHTVHCGPDAIYVDALGSADGSGDRHGGPGGILMLDPFTFEVLGPWELERGEQESAYDFGRHSANDVMVTSEWAKPHQFEQGIVAEELLAGKYGHRLHFWDLRKHCKIQTVDLGSQYQMLLELRPAHDPRKSYGFAGVVVSREDLSASIWSWYQDGSGKWQAQKTITIPAQSAAENDLPPFLKGFKAVPPLITDIALSPDDRYLYVSCWGTGELHQYDVSDPFHPWLTGKVAIGGIVAKRGHPQHPGSLLGGPQKIEISGDGRRVYATNSLYSTWDDQFYPEKLTGWMVKAEVNPQGGLAFDPNFFVNFGNTRPHQLRLENGASIDSFCCPT
jgi:methanethiol oxidase